MSIVIPDVGECALLDRALKSGNNITLKLYKTVSPAVGESSIAGHFTEADFAGYAAKALTPAGWNAASTSGGVSSSVYSALQTFTRSTAGTPQSCPGYYLVDAVTGVLVWFEEFRDGVGALAPISVSLAGEKIEFTPKIELA